MSVAFALSLPLLLATPHVDTPDGADHAAAPADDIVRIASVRLEGNKRTRDETLLELLPRRPPSTYRASELKELERRINNLEIFDQVVVRLDADVLVIAVREKWTLTPTFDFSTGETLADTEGQIGATEYNFLGRAAELGVIVGREQRGPAAYIWFAEHALRPNRWTMTLGGGFERSYFRFGDSENPTSAWARNRAGVEATWRTPYSYRLPIRYEVGTYYARELVEREIGSYSPPDGHMAGTIMMFTFDRYTWRDLVPEGFRARLDVKPGWFLPERRLRYSSTTSVIAGIKLGRTSVLALRAQHEAASSGNVNFSTLIGSQDGVRGLADAFYRNRQQAVLNVEARYAVKLAERWALQGVAFTDAAVFETLDVRGRPVDWRSALGVGGGLRIIPTMLTQIVGRLDLARLLYPTGRWFFQFGVTQYF